jgi:orotidine-5'-phosphate decarboxylase
MGNWISKPRTIIPACDVDLQRFEELIKATDGIEKIGAYKIGMILGLTYGLPKVVEVARKHTKKPLIYDHQKAGTDIPDTGTQFAQIVAKAGFDAVILFPQSGPATLTAWFQQSEKKGLRVIVGGKMTHERYIVSEGGYIDDEAADRIYVDAARLGVTDFVVPGNQPNFIKRIREMLEKSKVEPVFYAPGFIAQGGKISEAATAAGPRWHAIVGRAIYDNPDMYHAAKDLTANI